MIRLKILRDQTIQRIRITLTSFALRLMTKKQMMSVVMMIVTHMMTTLMMLMMAGVIMMTMRTTPLDMTKTFMIFLTMRWLRSTVSCSSCLSTRAEKITARGITGSNNLTCTTNSNLIFLQVRPVYNFNITQTYRKTFVVVLLTWDKEKILSPYVESNFRPLDSALQCFTTEPQRLYGERGLLRNRSPYDTRPTYC